MVRPARGRTALSLHKITNGLTRFNLFATHLFVMITWTQHYYNFFSFYFSVSSPRFARLIMGGDGERHQDPQQQSRLLFGSHRSNDQHHYESPSSVTTQHFVYRCPNCLQVKHSYFLTACCNNNYRHSCGSWFVAVGTLQPAPPVLLHHHHHHHYYYCNTNREPQKFIIPRTNNNNKSPCTARE